MKHVSLADEVTRQGVSPTVLPLSTVGLAVCTEVS